MNHPVYRSVNQVPTLLGIDRRLCILFGGLDFAVFRLSNSFLLAGVAFAIFWAFAYHLTKKDVQLPLIILTTWRQKRIYDPFK